MGVKGYNPDAHEFRASAKDSTNFYRFYDRYEPMAVVNSVGNPMMSFGYMADVDAAMPKRHGIPIVVSGRFANEFDRVARSDLFVDKAAAVNSLGRFAFELCYPGWIRL